MSAEQSQNRGIPDINGYHIGSCLGEGGYASVYEAANDLGQQVAVKVLKPTAYSDRKNFLHEVNTHSAVSNGKHIITLLGYGTNVLINGNVVPYMVLEYAEGGSLFRMLQKNPFPRIDTSVRVLLEIANALQYTYDRRIIHRDIKPGNILFASGTTKLSDFGTAVFVQEENVPRIGTLEYIPFDQIEGNLSNKTDMYALGLVGVQMFSGVQPFNFPNKPSQKRIEAYVAAHKKGIPSLITTRQQQWGINNSGKKDQDIRFLPYLEPVLREAITERSEERITPSEFHAKLKNAYADAKQILGKETVIVDMKPSQTEIDVRLLIKERDNYVNKGNYKAALGISNKLCILCPQNIEIVHGKGYILYLLRDYEQAVQVYKNAVDIDLNNSVTYANIAKMYFLLKKYFEAHEYVQKALHLDNNNSDLYIFLASVLETMGYFEDALTVRQKAEKIEMQKISQVTTNIIN